MKKLGILLVLALIIMSSCDDGHGGLLGSHNDVDPKQIESEYQIVKIDGCEYIIYDMTAGYSGYSFMAHKGNCSNSIHKNN